MTPIENAALDTAVKTTQGFFGRIFGPMADEFGLLKADDMRVRQLKNQLKNLEKVHAIVENENVTMKEINFKALFPLLEGTALEEDETLQNMYANLFVNYIDEAKNLTVHVYPRILPELSTNEAELLKFMKKHNLNWMTREHFPQSEWWLPEDQLMETPDDNLANLVRLDLIMVFGGVQEKTMPKYYLTRFGLNFIQPAPGNAAPETIQPKYRIRPEKTA